MPRLAIVISAVGSIESLEATLVSVLENRPADCEIVVALKQPYADPYDLKDEVRFVTPRKRASVTTVINNALATVRAPFVHVLASGCTVVEGWTEAPLSRFGDRQLAAVVPWVLDATKPDRLFATGVGYRTRGERYLIGHGAAVNGFEPPASVIGPALFAAFYRKAALDLVGGFSQALGPRQADADLALMFNRAGLTVTTEPRSQILATAEAESRDGHLRDALANERLYWRNVPERSTWGGIAYHWGHAAWDVLRQLPTHRAALRFFGRGRGLLEIGSHHRHQQLLTQLSKRALPPQMEQGVRIDGSHAAPTRRTAASVRTSAQ